MLVFSSHTVQDPNPGNRTTTVGESPVSIHAVKAMQSSTDTPTAQPDLTIPY